MENMHWKNENSSKKSIVCFFISLCFLSNLKSQATISKSIAKYKVYSKTTINKSVSMMGMFKTSINETITDTSLMEMKQESETKTILSAQLLGYRQKGKFEMMGKEHLIDSDKKPKKGEQDYGLTKRIEKESIQKMNFEIENGIVTAYKMNADRINDKRIKISEGLISALEIDGQPNPSKFVQDWQLPNEAKGKKVGFKWEVKREQKDTIVSDAQNTIITLRDTTLYSISNVSNSEVEIKSNTSMTTIMALKFNQLDGVNKNEPMDSLSLSLFKAAEELGQQKSTLTKTKTSVYNLQTGVLKREDIDINGGGNAMILTPQDAETKISIRVE